jgi:adenosylmethionine-8-amino-7-oxononanoate aminotransferase
MKERDRKVVWHPFTPLQGAPENIPLKSARGSILYTEDGRAIIDAVSSWCVNTNSHSHPVIAEAIYDQAKTLEHVIFAGFTHEPAINLSENILSILPDEQTKVFFSDDGSTAIEVGLKMSMQYWYNQEIKKRKIIAIDGAYHGDTFGAMSVGERGPFNEVFQPYLFDVEYIDLPTSENWLDVLSKFEKLASDPETGIFIFEPLVQGAAGMKMYSVEHLNELMKIGRKNDLILIADEVMTGFGRTGTWFATDQTEEKPDIYCLSKGLTGGSMALSLTTCNDRIFQAFDSVDVEKTFLHGHSFTANPIACAAANASFELLMQPECRQNIDWIHGRHLEFMEKMKSHPMFRDIRLMGTILAMELDTGGGTSYFNTSRNQIYNFFIDRGVLMRPLGNLIYILPPYVITDEELGKVYEVIEEFVATPDL